MKIVTNLAFLSSAFTGLVLWKRSPIFVPSNLPTKEHTSPVASSRLRRSMSRTSACKTRLEF